MRFAALYGNGAAMGFSPEQVDRMSVFQFEAALDGWLAVNSAEDGLSKAEEDDLWEWLQSKGC